MNPGEIINLKIERIKCHYNLTDEFQVFYSYLKLSNGKIIDLPHYHNLEKSLIDSILENSKKDYRKAKRINRKEREKIQGQRIVDIHYCFYENESDEERRAHIELSNGMYLTEYNYGVVGMSIGLILRSKEEFDRLKSELEDGFEIRSYLKEIKNVS